MHTAPKKARDILHINHVILPYNKHEHRYSNKEVHQQNLIINEMHHKHPHYYAVDAIPERGNT